jgi:hypothetical protein
MNITYININANKIWWPLNYSLHNINDDENMVGL